jgi:hypothetical protein
MVGSKNKKARAMPRLVETPGRKKRVVTRAADQTFVETQVLVRGVITVMPFSSFWVSEASIVSGWPRAAKPAAPWQRRTPPSTPSGAA